MRMNWKLLALALVLITVMVGVGQSEAGATPDSQQSVETVLHNWFGNPSGYATCQAERSWWTSSSYTTHSHPSELTETYVTFHCCLDLYGLSHRWNFSSVGTTGNTWSYNWSPVYSDSCP